MAEVPSLTLKSPSHIAMPALGFGSGTRSDSQEISDAVVCAIKLGYRHFDTASVYGTEAAIGAGLAQAMDAGLVTRPQLFVTSKLHSDMHDDVLGAVKSSLSNLKLDYLDLYLIHAPLKIRRTNYASFPAEEDFLPLDLRGTWQGMEECLQQGLARAIGVSNFSVKKLQDLMEHAKVIPAVNQVELHPVWQQRKLRDFCSSVGIQVVAWSPLGGLGKPWGSRSVLDNPVVQELASKYQKTPAQIILRWITTRGLGAIVKSYNPDRLAQNLQSFDFSLSEQDLAKIESIAPQERLAKWEMLCNSTTSPYKSPQELWDGEL
ncbi:methylecgonone reductase [Selaginella moellendorffii]|nr:methylecgonone reductase [Selaginella moellendorffii]|eukprot:XP_002988089.2 methylecgonone reductase [Selaginella moellendorffii]